MAGHWIDRSELLLSKSFALYFPVITSHAQGRYLTSEPVSEFKIQTERDLWYLSENLCEARVSHFGLQTERGRMWIQDAQ